jgi:hypothetical protein
MLFFNSELILYIGAVSHILTAKFIVKNNIQ